MNPLLNLEETVYLLEGDIHKCVQHPNTAILLAYFLQAAGDLLENFFVLCDVDVLELLKKMLK
jgi:hypothetical protein